MDTHLIHVIEDISSRPNLCESLNQMTIIGSRGAPPTNDIAGEAYLAEFPSNRLDAVTQPLQGRRLVRRKIPDMPGIKHDSGKPHS